MPLLSSSIPDPDSHGLVRIANFHVHLTYVVCDSLQLLMKQLFVRVHELLDQLSLAYIDISQNTKYDLRSIFIPFSPNYLIRRDLLLLTFCLKI